MRRPICNLGERIERACSVLVACLRFVLYIFHTFNYLYLSVIIIFFPFFFLYTHLTGLLVLFKLSRGTARYTSNCNNVDLVVQSAI